MSNNKPQNARTDFFVLPFECRLAWPHLAVKRTTDFNGKPLALDDQYYETTLFFPKTAADPNQCQNYGFVIGKLAWIVANQPGWNEQWPAMDENWPIKDCDDPKFLEKNAWARGHWRINPWSNGIIAASDVGNNPLPLDLNGEYRGLKGGDYVLASVNTFGWSYANSRRGFSIGIEGVKKTRDGEPIGAGQRSVSQMFGAPTGAPVAYAPAAAAPPLPGQPPQAYMPAPAPQQQYQPAAYQPPQPQPFTPAAPGGYPTPAAAPSPYAPNAGSISPAPAPQMYAPAPGASGTMTGAYPSSAPQQQYAPPPGNPVAPPVYQQPQAAQPPAYTPPAPQLQYAPAPQAAPPPQYAPQPPQYAPPIGTR